MKCLLYLLLIFLLQVCTCVMMWFIGICILHNRHVVMLHLLHLCFESVKLTLRLLYYALLVVRTYCIYHLRRINNSYFLVRLLLIFIINTYFVAKNFLIVQTQWLIIIIGVIIIMICNVCIFPFVILFFIRFLTSYCGKPIVQCLF